MVTGVNLFHRFEQTHAQVGVRRGGLKECVGFLPRSKLADLQTAVVLIERARRHVVLEVKDEALGLTHANAIGIDLNPGFEPEGK